MDICTSATKEVVLRLGKALNDENYVAARRYVSDNMKYVGPFGSRDGAEAYLHEIERLRLKFDIQKIFADNKDVCVLYDITVSGIRLFACGWFQIEAGTVRSMRVTFDPRPLLAGGLPGDQSPAITDAMIRLVAPSPGIRTSCVRQDLVVLQYMRSGPCQRSILPDVIHKYLVVPIHPHRDNDAAAECA